MNVMLVNKKIVTNDVANWRNEYQLKKVSAVNAQIFCHKKYFSIVIRFFDKGVNNFNATYSIPGDEKFFDQGKTQFNVTSYHFFIF